MVLVVQLMLRMLYTPLVIVVLLPLLLLSCGCWLRFVIATMIAVISSSHLFLRLSVLYSLEERDLRPFARDELTLTFTSARKTQRTLTALKEL